VSPGLAPSGRRSARGDWRIRAPRALPPRPGRPVAAPPVLGSIRTHSAADASGTSPRRSDRDAGSSHAHLGFLRGRRMPYAPSRATKVRRGIPRSAAARVWLPAHCSSASRIRRRSRSSSSLRRSLPPAAAVTPALPVAPPGGAAAAGGASATAGPTGFAAVPASSRRCSGSSVPPLHSTTARSIALRSSRTLPDQRCAVSAVIASGPSAGVRRPSVLAARAAKRGSSARSRRACPGAGDRERDPVEPEEQVLPERTALHVPRRRGTTRGALFTGCRHRATPWRERVFSGSPGPPVESFFCSPDRRSRRPW